MRVFLVTHSPSPYQVELLNQLAAIKEVDLFVAYLFRADKSRRWGTPHFCHEHCFLDADTKAFCRARHHCAQDTLAVFNFYMNPMASSLMAIRHRSKLAWAFWGERLGYRYHFLGRLARRFKLNVLHSSKAPIWGIGRFGVESYKREFGTARQYFNIPYFSDLGRFRTPRTKCLADRVILFTGSLIARKGVDLLAKCFRCIANTHPNVRLRILGEGTLYPYLRDVLEPVAPQVDFLGFQDWPDLPAHYAAADLLCVPSRYDGWGLVVPEGLAAGLPVIATDRMGAAIELLNPGINGWRVRAGDLSALEIALRNALCMPPEEFAKMSCAASASIREHSLANGAERFLTAAVNSVGNWRS